MSQKPESLYETDFVKWAHHNAALLRSGALPDADIAHIAEEIEDLGNNWERAQESRLTQLLLHLLKLQYQPAYPGTRGWRTSVANQRIELERLMRKALSLRARLQAVLAEVYLDARKLAIIETGLPESIFPVACPWTVEQIMDQDFFRGDNA